MCIATEENELGNNKSSSCGMTKEPRIMEHVKYTFFSWVPYHHEQNFETTDTKYAQTRPVKTILLVYIYATQLTKMHNLNDLVFRSVHGHIQLHINQWYF